MTLENDATAVESHKKDLLGMYKGGCGYMPVNGVIAELGAVAADEFRDGNVTPSYDVLRFFKETLKSVPRSVEEICARLDGAYYNHDLIKFMRKKNIQFSITGKLSPPIVEWIVRLPDADWKPLKKITERGEENTDREWAEMSWTSALGSQADMRRRMLRTIVTRKKAHQWEMFQSEHAEAAEKDRYEEIETNRDWAGDRLIRWHKEVINARVCLWREILTF